MRRLEPTALTIKSLKFVGYLDAAVLPNGAGEIMAVHVNGITPRGRRAVGQWPSEDAGELLLQVIRAEIEREPDAERKGRLGRLLEAASAVGKDVLTAVAVGVVKGAAGIP